MIYARINEQKEVVEYPVTDEIITNRGHTKNMYAEVINNSVYDPKVHKTRKNKFVYDAKTHTATLTYETTDYSIDEMQARWRKARNKAIEDVQWRYDRYNRELRLGLTPTDDIDTLDTYVQGLANLPEQAGEWWLVDIESFN